LEGEGKKYDYLVNGQKCWLIVKSQELAEEAEHIFGEEVNIIQHKENATWGLL
jgi:hypothetical protein